MSPGDGSTSQAATETKNAIASEGQELAGTAAEQASAFAGEVKTQVGSVMRDARGQLEEKADEQARRIASGMQDAKRQLESMAESADDGLVTNVTRQLASSLGKVSDTIEDGGLTALADEVRSFARRQPGLFLLGAGASGFLLARLLRHAGNGDASTSKPASALPSAPAMPTPPSATAADASPAFASSGDGPGNRESDLAHASGSDRTT